MTKTRPAAAPCGIINLEKMTKDKLVSEEVQFSMKLSISNIAWPAEFDEDMYAFLQKNGFNGLEIAPTRIFPVSPYNNLAEARRFAISLKETYDLTIPSMQSIWFGITESIFGSDSDRAKLIDYTKKSIDFAAGLNCTNLVFGCPKNRAIPAGMSDNDYSAIAHEFFTEIGSYAVACGVFLAIEPNPPIYNTNFINTTEEAFKICKKLNSTGIKANIDIGTLIYNNEDIEILKNNIGLINHVHISEPHLAPIEKRQLHIELLRMLKDLSYQNFISIEMSNNGDINTVKNAALYLKGLYDDILQY